MNEYHVHLNSDKISLVTVKGAKARYEMVGEDTINGGEWDFVIRDEDGAEKFRSDRFNILYVRTSALADSCSA